MLGVSSANAFNFGGMLSQGGAKLGGMIGDTKCTANACGRDNVAPNTVNYCFEQGADRIRKNSNCAHAFASKYCFPGTEHDQACQNIAKVLTDVHYSSAHNGNQNFGNQGHYNNQQNQYGNNGNQRAGNQNFRPQGQPNQGQYNQGNYGNNQANDQDMEGYYDQSQYDQGNNGNDQGYYDNNQGNYDNDQGNYGN